MTLLIFISAVIILLAGAILTITNPDTLSFNEYLDAVKNFAIAVGILGAGKAIKNGVAGHATPAFDTKPPPESPEGYAYEDDEVLATNAEFEGEEDDLPVEAAPFEDPSEQQTQVFDRQQLEDTQEIEGRPEGDVRKFGQTRPRGADFSREDG